MVEGREYRGRSFVPAGGRPGRQVIKYLNHGFLLNTSRRRDAFRFFYTEVYAPRTLHISRAFVTGEDGPGRAAENAMIQNIFQQILGSSLTGKDGGLNDLAISTFVAVLIAGKMVTVNAFRARDADIGEWVAVTSPDCAWSLRFGVPRAGATRG